MCGWPVMPPSDNESLFDSEQIMLPLEVPRRMDPGTRVVVRDASGFKIEPAEVITASTLARDSSLKRLGQIPSEPLPKFLNLRTYAPWEPSAKIVHAVVNVVQAPNDNVDAAESCNQVSDVRAL